MESRGSIPNTFIIGAPKCGTTSLYEYLRTHPEVFFPTRKEPRYWCSDFEVRRNRSSQRFHSLADYLELFRPAASSASIVAEASTLYLRSGVAVPRILEFNSAVKFIVMVRNPIEMFRSWHYFLLNHFIEDTLDPEQAWHLQTERRNGRQIPSGCDVAEKLQYRSMISLGEQVSRFMDWVPENQRLVILNDDFATDPAGQYLKVLDFLGLKSDGRVAFPHENQAAVYRARWLAKNLTDPPSWLVQTAAWMRRRCPWAFSPGLRGRFLDRLRQAKPKPKLPNDFRSYLAQEMRDDVASLSTLLGRDLGHWTAEETTGNRARG